MGTYLKKVMLFQSVTSNRMIECYTHWELYSKKVDLCPNSPSTLTEAIIEFEVKPDIFIGSYDRPDLISLYIGIPILPAGHKIIIRVYEFNANNERILIDEETVDTVNIPMGLY